ncbi:hypothetical protein AMECASPLE_037117 [Ameca splendens]|uniref:Uncharacterized protein n=1 Tax=Ameca splendens TaxID=208324 RepID=A0ABV0Y827_9TELE
MAQGGPEAAEALTAVMERRKDEVLCFYHRRFGVKAKRCIPPCLFQLQGNERAGACWWLCAGSSNKLLFILNKVSGRRFLPFRFIMPVSAADILCQSQGPPPDAANDVSMDVSLTGTL